MLICSYLRVWWVGLGLLVFGTGSISAQQLPRPAAPSYLAGKWTYRSFVSNPDQSVQPNQLLFGIGTMEFAALDGERLSGTLGGDGWQLNLIGTFGAGEPQTLRFQGRGIINGEEWVYDYLGYIVPMWQNGVDQRPAIVGTIVRTVSHSKGASPAGVVAEWIAVRQDGQAASSLLRGQSSAPYRKKLRQLYLQEELPGAERPADELPVEKPSSFQPLQPQLFSTLLPAGTPAPANTLAPRVPSLQPLTITSHNGRVDVGELVVGYNDPQAPNPLRIGTDGVHLRTYNGQLVGPVIRAKAGDTIYLTLRNSLPPEPAETGGGHETNGHHEWNTTNLHFHGLHVAPQGKQDAESDNVLLSIKPGEAQKYEVHIPPDHVAGTFWYHAHRHGSTAAQVASGLCGALIIERDDKQHNLDSIPEIAAAAQEVMVLQAIPYLKSGSSLFGTIERSSDGSGDNENTMFAPGQWRKLGRYITVNGQRIPTITIAPGEVRRLRLIAAGQREPMRLRIEKPATATDAPVERLMFHEIAVDGLPTGGIRDVPELELFPGYRSDVLVQAPADASGDYYLLDGNAATGSGADGSPEPLSWIARVRIAGAPVTMALPKTSDLQDQRLPDLVDANATNERYAFYGLVLTPSSINFYISRQKVPVGQVPLGNEFDPQSVRELPFGQTERWLVGSRNGGGLNVTHPFHIHTNPFLVTQVLDSGNRDVTVSEFGGPIWRDTLAMKQGYTYRLLTKYTDFTGGFVSHCHILDHEDNGMMERITIVKESTSASAKTVRQTSIADTTSVIGRPIASAIPGPNGKPSVLIFVKGSFCAHCMGEVNQMAAKLSTELADVTVISESTEQDLENFPNLPFRLIADPNHFIFKQYGVFDGTAKHATIVRDRAGRELLREVGDQPFTNVDAVTRALDQTGPHVVIAVRETDTTDDDYITWAPAACTIRIENGDAGEPDLNIVLSNGSNGANPDAGSVAFAPANLAAGQTATQPNLELKLRQDGTPAKFFIAGTKPSSLTPSSLTDKGRDTVIEARENVPNGRLLAQTAVMVRVRKRIDTLNDLELTQFMKALNDLHRVRHRYEWYVLLHRLATHHGPDDGDPQNQTWPDQAHLGPAFIAWHRAFLLQLERELQEKFPWVALPYWIQGPSVTLFDAKKFGTNANGSEVVAFDPASPLYGWSIDTLPHDSRVPLPGPMGLLRRSGHDHNLPVSFYQQWGPRFENVNDFKHAMPNFWSNFPPPGVRNTYRFNTEANPHNNGHNELGPDSIWMQNCRESNADPVFWVFHCNHDYLWARWQYYHNRFISDGSDPESYWPNDAFTDVGADQSVPLGHHLNDTMWPWDGSEGQVVNGNASSNRPTPNTFGQFPASALPGIWPRTSTKPRPADVIDYLGIGTRDNQLGFCYDTIPWGARVQPGPLAKAPAPELNFSTLVFFNSQLSPEIRRSAFPQLIQDPASVNPKQAIQTIRDVRSASTLRLDALNLLAQISPEDALSESINLLTSPGTPANVGAAALQQLEGSLHFSLMSRSEMDRVHEVLRSVLRSSAAAEMRAQALRLLAAQADAAAKSVLLDSLAKPAEAPVSVAEAISLLRFFVDQSATIREYLYSKNEDAVIAALQSLHQDVETAETRRKIAIDAGRDTPVRRAAIQSLMYGEDQKDFDALLAIFADLADDLSLRAEAIASARIFLQRHFGQFSPEQKIALAEKIRVVPSDEAGAGSLGDLKAQALSALSGTP